MFGMDNPVAPMVAVRSEGKKKEEIVNMSDVKFSLWFELCDLAMRLSMKYNYMMYISNFTHLLIFFQKHYVAYKQVNSF